MSHTITVTPLASSASRQTSVTMSLVLVITNLILSIVNFPPYNEQVPHAVVFARRSLYCGNFTIFFHSSQEVFPFFSAIPAIFVRHNSSFSLDLPSFSKDTDIFRPCYLLPAIFQFFQFAMLGGFLAGNFIVPAFSRFPLCRCVFLPLYDRGVLLSAAHFAGMVVIHSIICGGRNPDCGAEKYPRKNYRAVLWG